VKAAKKPAGPVLVRAAGPRHIVSGISGETLKEIAVDLKHEITWLARCVHALHGDDGHDEMVSSLRRAVVALSSLAEDVSELTMQLVEPVAEEAK
jgi:hypothetical protein